jgi:hypothetical protein
MFKALLLVCQFFLSYFLGGAHLLAQSSTLLRTTISSGSVSDNRFMATVGEAFISSGTCLRIGAQPGFSNGATGNLPNCATVATKNIPNPVQVGVAPNPTSGDLTITINQEADRTYTIELVNLVGQTMFEVNGLTTGANKISFTQIPAGTYALLIKDYQGAIQFSKLIIKTNQ